MTQDSENWEQLQALFHLAEVTPAEERERVLAEHCSDPEIRRRAMDIFVAANIDGLEAAPRGAPALSGKIGPYRVLRHIGAGGIGSVYLVERVVGGALQRSALKVLAPHAAGASFAERFHREQHILASLDHPNITRMFDAGLSEDGQPYLVMEFVDGIHLDTYCDEMNLSISERLQIFLCVCDAVAYAHRNLVVHLDLKPANILVTSDGTVKLLDFGTSKLIQPDSLLTVTVMATPAYASPEQLRNEPVTTACDVYELGVILFEMLSGYRPGGDASVAVMIERALNEEEPGPLPDAVTGAAAARRGLSESRLRAVLRGDLATIVAKCLSSRPKDRYSSVDSLIGDIQRFIDGRTVLARPQTTFYRFSKFVRRNRRTAMASLVIAIVLLASLSYGAWRQHQALREGQRALRMQTFVYRLFKLANSNYTGKPAATVPELLQLGVKILPEYVKDPADLRKAQLSLAESMFENGDLDNAQKVFEETITSAKLAGDIQSEAESEAFSGNIAYLQGQMDMGESLTKNALRLSRKPGVSPSVRVWSAVYYAWNRENNGFRSDENMRLLEFAVKECREYNLPSHETADALYNLGAVLELRGNLDEAERTFSEALQAYGQDPSALCEQSEIYGDMAFIRDMRGDVLASLPLYQRAYDGYKMCSGTESRGALMEQDYMAGALIKLGRAKEAVAMMETAMPAWRRIAGSSPDLAEPLYFLSRAYVETGRYAEGEKLAKELVEVQTGKVAPTDRRFGISHFVWARALVGQLRYQEALPHAEVADKLLALNAHSAGAKQAGAEAHQLLLNIQAKLGSR
ncbi:MAG: serine/threonine-protein kinase [Candidatus Korobacteraceae bacterium]|jgi:serine/threonine-protein kinase